MSLGDNSGRIKCTLDTVQDGQPKNQNDVIVNDDQKKEYSNVFDE